MKNFAISAVLIAVYYATITALGFSMANMAAGLAATLFIFLPLIGIPYAVYATRANTSSKRALNQARKLFLDKLRAAGFDITDEIFLNKAILMLDRGHRKVGMAYDMPGGGLRLSIYPTTAILSCAIVTDSYEVSAVSVPDLRRRTRFFGSGPLIGSIRADRIKTTRIRSLDLRILVDDEKRDGHWLNFFKDPDGVDERAVRPCLEQIQQWHLKIELLMAGETIPASASAQQLRDHMDALRLKRARTAG